MEFKGGFIPQARCVVRDLYASKRAGKATELIRYMEMWARRRFGFLILEGAEGQPIRGPY